MAINEVLDPPPTLVDILTKLADRKPLILLMYNSVPNSGGGGGGGGCVIVK